MISDDMLKGEARRFLDNVPSNHPHKEDAERAIGRLLEWSNRRADQLCYKASEGKDQLIGVTKHDKGPSLWRVYPRQDDAGKVAILPGAQHYVPSSVQARVREILGALNAGVAPTGELEISLQRIASKLAWKAYEDALNLTFDALGETPPPAP
jgi:hypothetical protein